MYSVENTDGNACHKCSQSEKCISMFGATAFMINVS